MSDIRTIRPGILVSLKTHKSGNTKYRKRDIAPATITESGTLVSKWETDKTVFDPDEQRQAEKVVSTASYLIRKLCVKSDHGLLCLDSRAEELDEAIAEGRAMVDEFNARARYTRVEVNVICGRVVADDVQATRAIFSETEKFLSEMQAGLAELDVKKVRATMRKAKDVGQMLAPDANATIRAAVSVASEACKKIVKAGNQVAIEIDQAAIDTIGQARSAFLDFDFDPEAPEVEAPQIIAPRAIDFGGDMQPYELPTARSSFAREFEAS